MYKCYSGLRRGDQRGLGWLGQTQLGVRPCVDSDTWEEQSIPDSRCRHRSLMEF